jgi:cellulose biosynthesis protein BcsQ
MHRSMRLKKYVNSMAIKFEEPIPVDTKFRDASELGKVPSDLDADGRGIRIYRHLLGSILKKADAA